MSKESKLVKVETNPRWQSAPFELQFVIHHDVSHSLVRDEQTRLWKEPRYPTRYANAQDARRAENPIPPLLATYEDGSTKEIF